MPQWAKSAGVRVLGAVPLLLLLSALIFLLMDLVPGDAAQRLAGETSTDQQVARIRAELGLDQPLPTRYLHWLEAGITGDLGNSLSTNEPVTDMLLQRLPVTLSLLGVSLMVAVVVGVTAGLLAAMNHGSWVDRLVGFGSSVLLASPPFWVGLLLVLFFSLRMGWLPALNYVPFSESPGEWFRHLVLPAVAMAGIPAAEIARQLRGSLLDVLATDYMLAARAKGLGLVSLMGKHGLKNSSVPVVTVIGFRAAQAVGSTVVVEQVFNIQGIGSLAVRSVLQSDVPVLLGITLLTTLIVILVNLAVDLSYPLLSPVMRAS